VGLTNVWVRTLSDGLIRADHIVGIDAHRTPQLAEKHAHWLLALSCQLRWIAAAAKCGTCPRCTGPCCRPPRSRWTDRCRWPTCLPSSTRWTPPG
jgi:hypothetical protein